MRQGKQPFVAAFFIVLSHQGQQTVEYATIDRDAVFRTAASGENIMESIEMQQ